ncbi:MAG: hypothetical protein P8124_08300, partial [Gammaproteobacteria bacterium]
MRTRYRSVMGGLLFSTTLILTANANATLVSRLGGLAYYDTATNLTWLSNADAGYGSVYDSADGTTDGKMTWANANAWAASLHVGGVTGWRLPDVSPINGATYNYNYSMDGSTDWGYNISAQGTVYAGSKASEMAYLYYNTLGNSAAYDVSGTQRSCATTTCFSNTGPFTNVQSSVYGAGYWTATADAADATS